MLIWLSWESLGKGGSCASHIPSSRSWREGLKPCPGPGEVPHHLKFRVHPSWVQHFSRQLQRDPIELSHPSISIRVLQTQPIFLSHSK